MHEDIRDGDHHRPRTGRLSGTASGPIEILVAERMFGPNEVEVRMVAGRARVSTVRTLAVDAALREGVDPDAVSDMRLAVDEVCAAVLNRARPDGVLTCRLVISPERVDITVTAPVPDDRLPDSRSLGRHELTDTARCWTTGPAGGRLLHLQISRRWA